MNLPEQHKGESWINEIPSALEAKSEIIVPGISPLIPDYLIGYISF
jgi:hypothetical protein